MSKLVHKIYYWFWHDIMRRREPYTHQLRRMAKAHPWLFLGAGIGNAAFWTWLLLHLGGFV